jgi:hypothetical protein
MRKTIRQRTDLVPGKIPGCITWSELRYHPLVRVSSRVLEFARPLFRSISLCRSDPWNAPLAWRALRPAR